MGDSLCSYRDRGVSHCAWDAGFLRTDNQHTAQRPAWVGRHYDDLYWSLLVMCLVTTVGASAPSVVQQAILEVWLAASAHLLCQGRKPAHGHTAVLACHHPLQACCRSQQSLAPVSMHGKAASHPTAQAHTTTHTTPPTPLSHYDADVSR